MSRIHPVQHQTLTRNENRRRTTLLSPPGSRRILLLLSSSFLEGMSGVDVIARSEAGETDAQSNELLAGGGVSNSSSRGGGLAPGALWEWGVGDRLAVSCMRHADAEKQLLYLATNAQEHLLFPCAMACVWYLSLCQLFRCGSIFDFSISQLTGWQFKTTEWNISQPSSKLQWHTHEIMVIL